MPPRPYILHEANYRQLLDAPPNVAVLPWGATEAHNYHLPHGTDVIEASTVAERGAAVAFEAGGKPPGLPALPFCDNAPPPRHAGPVSPPAAAPFALVLDVARAV